MNKIEFSNQKAPKTFWVVNFLVIIFIIAIMFLNSSFNDGLKLSISSDYNLITVMLSIVCVLGVFFVFFYKKINYNFFVDDEGIGFKDKKFFWSDIKNYHMLGDSQDERFGLVSSKYTATADINNPYYNMNIFVLKTKSSFMGNSFRLQLSSDRVNEFEQILANKGILRESKARMYFTGVNKWFIILFAIPFGLLILWMLFGMYFGG